MFNDRIRKIKYASMKLIINSRFANVHCTVDSVHSILTDPGNIDGRSSFGNQRIRDRRLPNAYNIRCALMNALKLKLNKVAVRYCVRLEKISNRIQQIRNHLITRSPNRLFSYLLLIAMLPLFLMDYEQRKSLC